MPKYRVKAQIVVSVFTHVDADDELHAKALAAERSRFESFDGFYPSPDLDWYEEPGTDKITNIEVDGVL